MLLAQGRQWRIALARDEAVSLALQREGLSEELQELRDLRIEIPLERWNLVVRNVYSDRKLLGGVLLDCATPKELVATAIGDDRILAELQRVVLEATVDLLERGALSLVRPREPASD